MAKRSVVEWDSSVEVSEEVYVPKTVRLVLKKNVNLRITGAVTGKIYYFAGAGSEVDVDEYDAPVMLEKKPARPCCSGTMADNYFEKVG